MDRRPDLAVPPAYAIRRGLPPGARPAAAALYWEAFGPKLGRVLGPERRALAFLDRAMRDGQCLAAVALNDGRLLGMVGFRAEGASFAGGTAADLRAVYGAAGGLWRAALLGMLARGNGDGRGGEAGRFVIDGLCVVPGLRGHGIGRALIASACTEAAFRGHAEVGLDVVDTNLRARALYERVGFRAERTECIGALRHVFGFSAATTMVRAAA